jgi:hypothetical protein
MKYSTSATRNHMPHERSMAIADAERIEADFMSHYVSSATGRVKSRLGTATMRIGGGVALSMRHDVTGYWSKALGFGFTEPITEKLMSHVLAFYEAEGTAGAVIQIAPSVLPPNWADICVHNGIQAGSPWVKLACPTTDFVPADQTLLRVGPVFPADAEEWASTTLRGFGMPEDGLADMMAASVHEYSEFRPFAAWDGDEMVGTANLYVRGEIGSLNSAATLLGHQNQGAQSALVAARAKAAADEGCRWLVAETGVPEEGTRSPSLNNLVRAGFRPLYERQNWNWRPPTAPGEHGTGRHAASTDTRTRAAGAGASQV